VGLALIPKSSEDGNFQAMTGASNKPFDYLACGLAVLVSDLPDWCDLFVRPGYGLACDPAQPASISAALRYFLDTPGAARRMGTSGQKRIASDWNYELQFEKVLKTWAC
jgi:glycosyltransferase involved in cell wall biosynthesis